MPSVGPVRRRRRARWAHRHRRAGPSGLHQHRQHPTSCPPHRGVESFRDNTFRVLDAATAAGVDWIDTARSYGRAEEFVGQWWRQRAAGRPRLAGERADHLQQVGLRVRRRLGPVRRGARGQGPLAGPVRAQLALTRATLPRFHLYQVHSLTLDSPLFEDGRAAGRAGRAPRFRCGGRVLDVRTGGRVSRSCARWSCRPRGRRVCSRRCRPPGTCWRPAPAACGPARPAVSSR